MSNPPGVRPVIPHFSSGPCAKRPGWSLQALTDAVLGRSHRSKIGKAKLKRAIDLTREVLEVPADYRIGIVPASDTGAVEMALWSLLGPAARHHAGLGIVRRRLGQRRPEAAQAQGRHGAEGAVRRAARSLQGRSRRPTWCSPGTAPPPACACRTPTGSRPTAQGLTICDATSAAFAQQLDWAKLDVVTFSWQKALGGEAAHGMLVLSPRAVERLESYTPPWPLPKIFRMTKGGKLNEGIFEGETINTPSMLCVEDYLDTLDWGKSIGGLNALIARADANAKAIADWVARTPWIEFLASDPAIRSNTSVCLKVVDPAVLKLPADAQAKFVKGIAAALEKEGVAYDIDAYRDAPPGLRIWCGATVERVRRRGADALARLGLCRGQGRAAEGGVSTSALPCRARSCPRRRPSPGHHLNAAMSTLDHRIRG